MSSRLCLKVPSRFSIDDVIEALSLLIIDDESMSIKLHVIDIGRRFGMSSPKRCDQDGEANNRPEESFFYLCLFIIERVIIILFRDYSLVLGLYLSSVHRRVKRFEPTPNRLFDNNLITIYCNRTVTIITFCYNTDALCVSLWITHLSTAKDKSRPMTSPTSNPIMNALMTCPNLCP